MSICLSFNFKLLISLSNKSNKLNYLQAVRTNLLTALSLGLIAWLSKQNDGHLYVQNFLLKLLVCNP
jgi:hypothetical protein